MHYSIDRFYLLTFKILPPVALNQRGALMIIIDKNQFGGINVLNIIFDFIFFKHVFICISSKSNLFHSEHLYTIDKYSFVICIMRAVYFYHKKYTFIINFFYYSFTTVTLFDKSKINLNRNHYSFSRHILQCSTNKYHNK